MAHSVPGGTYRLIPTSEIVPPRVLLRPVDKALVTYEELRDSIAKNGLLQPIVVCEHAKGWEVVGGNRRYTACVELGLPSIHCICFPKLSDEHYLALQIEENAQQLSTSKQNYARQMLRLLRSAEAKGDMSLSQLSVRLNKGPDWITHQLYIAKLPDHIHKMVLAGHIIAANAYALSKVPPHLIEGFVSAAASMVSAEFRKLVAHVTKQFQEAKQRGQILGREELVSTYKPTPNLRSRNAVLDELELQLVGSAVIAAENCKTLVDAFYAGLKWALKIDAASLQVFRKLVLDDIAEKEVDHALKLIYAPDRHLDSSTNEVTQ